MDSSTVRRTTGPTVTPFDDNIGTTQPVARGAQGCDDAARQLVAVGDKLAAASKIVERLEDLAEQTRAGEDSDDPGYHLDAVEAELGWLREVLAEAVTMCSGYRRLP